MDEYTQNLPQSRDQSQPIYAQMATVPVVTETIVTTRTITTTSYPPFVLQAPRNLADRNLSLYPLAATPTPDILKKARIEVGGRQAIFREADDSEEALEQYNDTRNTLQAHNGTVREIVTNTVLPPVYKPRVNRGHAQFGSTRKNSTLSTPPLSSDAAERASFRPQNKRPRMQPPPISIPSSRPSTATHGPPKLMKHAREEIPGSEDDDLDTRIDLDMRGLPRHKSRQTISPRREERSVFPVPGSATPPADEEEYEAFGVPETYLEPQGHTVANATDASLPSPSLSPITAAANQNKRPVPPLFHEKGILSPPARLPRSPQTMKSKTTLQAPFADTAPSNAGPRSHTPSFTEIPGMIDSFDAMPEGLKAYVLFQMLRRCTKPTLHLVSDAMAPALKCDFIARLPLELSINVISHLDAQSLCRASQVSQKWRQTIDTDEKLWWNRLTRDGYTIKVDELKKAMDEGWGWQAPDGPNGFEENLAMTRRESDAVSDITMDDRDLTDDVSSPPRKKHKAATKSSTSKQHKSNESIVLKTQKQLSLMSTNPIDWVRLADPTAGPQTIADASKGSIPDPATGLPSIREHHLFKTLYQRHHSIRHSWMDPTTKPRHLAFRAHQRHVVTCLQFDQDKIITGSDDAAIDIYNTKTGESIRRLHGHEGGVWALSYRGNTLVSGSTDRSVRVWDINEGEEMHVFQGHTSTVRCLVVVEPHEVGRTADGKMIMLPRFPLIITGSRDSTCRVWRLPNAHEVRVKQTGPPQNEGENPYYIRTLQGHMHSVRAIAAFCDTLVSGSYDTTVRVWKISTGELVHRLQGHTQKVYSVVLDYERNRCMSGSMDNLVKVWSLESGTCLFNLEGHTSLVGLLDLKDNCLVSAAADSTLRVWDPQTGRCVHDLSAHTGAITCFAHDGDKVISGSDRTLKMWNTKTGECVRDLLTDLNGVWQIGFDERRCVAAVQRSDFTYIEILDFGAARDGVQESKRGYRCVVDRNGKEVDEDWYLAQHAQALAEVDQVMAGPDVAGAP